MYKAIKEWKITDLNRPKKLKNVTLPWCLCTQKKKTFRFAPLVAKGHVTP